MKLRFLPILCVLLTGCPTTKPPGELITSGAPTAAASFVAGDVFEVRVFGEEELSGSFQVQEDGSIEFPLLGRVEIAGLTQAAAAKELETRLADGYLQRPNVTVIVLERKSVEVSVLGEVTKPGTFPFVERLTLVQAISEAGGLGPLAAPRRVKLIRESEEGPQTFQLSLEDITAGRASDITLQPGDIVFVPESPI